MVISIAVGLVIIAVIYAAVNMGQRSTVNVERKVAAHQDARAALELMSLEIQMASFNPTYATNIWVAPGNCTPGSGNQSYRGIQAATDSSITVESDINENGVIGNPNEVITYAYDSTNQYITRSTGCSGGSNQPFLGAMPGDPRAVRVINGTSTPRFLSSGTSTPREPRSRTDCRRGSRISPGSTSPFGWRRRIKIKFEAREDGWSIPRV